jgi:glucokinase
MILAGDIGGTKINLALFIEQDGDLKEVAQETFQSEECSGLNDILADFTEAHKGKIACAGIAVAGPVRDGYCEVTNLDNWRVDKAEIQGQLGIDSVWLLNDMTAMACAVPFLPAEDFQILQAGSDDPLGRVAVIAAGTGLGQAFLMPQDRGQYLPIDTEGGHCDFAPRTDVEIKLMQFLKDKYGRLSIERVLSGAGLINIYRFLCQSRSIKSEPSLTLDVSPEKRARAIVRLGLIGESSVCQQALEMFVDIYGAVTGNMALQLLTRGGVVLGGGIAPALISLLKQRPFIDSFCDKGRFSRFMKEIPVRVIMNEKASLIGAAQYALGKRILR